MQHPESCTIANMKIMSIVFMTALAGHLFLNSFTGFSLTNVEPKRDQIAIRVSQKPLAGASGLFCFCYTDFSATIQDQDSLLVGPKLDKVDLEEIDAAKQKVATTKASFDRLKALVERGSISKARLHRMELEMRVAELELETLLDPSSGKRNRRLVANLNLNYARKKFETSKRLFSSGSVSELDHRRDLYQLKYAEIAWKEAVGEISSGIAKLQTAEQKLKLAQIELELGKRLFKKRSLSRTTLEQLQQRVQQATDELKKLKQQQELNKQKLKQQRRT